MQVSLPPGDAMLLSVTPQDIAKLPAAIQAAADAAAAPPAERRPSQPGDGSTPTAAAAGSSSIRVARGSSDGSSPAAGPAGSSHPRSSTAAGTPRAVAPSMLASTWLPCGSTAAAAAADPSASTMIVGAAPAAAAAAGSSGLGDLSVENARLRAELAGLLAQQAAKELGEGLAAATVGPSATTAAAAGSASHLLASSVSAAGAASSMALAASTSAAAAAGGGQAGESAAAQRPYGHGGVPVVPASVTAPLPSVSAALQQVQQQQEGAATAAASQRALTLGPVKVSQAVLLMLTRPARGGGASVGRAGIFSTALLSFLLLAIPYPGAHCYCYASHCQCVPRK